MYICKYCGKEFETKQQLGGHLVHCKMNPKFKEYKENIDNGLKNSDKRVKRKHICICPKCKNEYIVFCTDDAFEKGKYKKFCSRKCANSRIHSDETKEKISQSINEYVNKIIPQTSYCKWCGKEIEAYYYTQGGEKKRKNYCCDECRKKDTSDKISKSFVTSKRNYSIGGTYAKHGWFKGIHCDSSWELAFVIYCIDHNINIKRCNLKLKYTYNNKEHLYFPDFEIDGKIYEIKGWETEKDREKKKQYPDIKVLYKKDMKIYLDYAIEKYGKDFISLYED